MRRYYSSGEYEDFNKGEGEVGYIDLGMGHRKV